MTLYFCLEQLRYVRTQKPLYYYDQRSSSTLRSEVTLRKAREYIYILESQLNLINDKATDNVLKRRLHNRIMEKSIFWYLDLALSNKKKIRSIYSKLYLRRMDYRIIDCFKSANIPFKNKISFILCKVGLTGFVKFNKNIFS